MIMIPVVSYDDDDDDDYRIMNPDSVLGAEHNINIVAMIIES